MKRTETEVYKVKRYQTETTRYYKDGILHATLAITTKRF